MTADTAGFGILVVVCATAYIDFPFSISLKTSKQKSDPLAFTQSA